MNQNAAESAYLSAIARRSKHNTRYGVAHRLTRKMVDRLVRSGAARCARGSACKRAEIVDGELVGGMIEPGEPWDLDHHDSGRGYIGPSHAACNRGAPNRNNTSRDW